MSYQRTRVASVASQKSCQHESWMSSCESGFMCLRFQLRLLWVLYFAKVRLPVRAGLVFCWLCPLLSVCWGLDCSCSQLSTVGSLNTDSVVSFQWSLSLSLSLSVQSLQGPNFNIQQTLYLPGKPKGPTYQLQSEKVGCLRVWSLNCAQMSARLSSGSLEERQQS